MIHKHLNLPFSFIFFIINKIFKKKYEEWDNIEIK